MGKFKDLTGQRFNRLIIQQPTKNRDTRGNVIWSCKCDCGNIVNISSNNLQSGNTKSCGCIYLEQISNLGKDSFKDLTGMKFGRLTVISENGRSPAGGVVWECICNCGNKTSVRSTSLIEGFTQSCGCLQKETYLSNIVDITGQKFGRLTVLESTNKRSGTSVLWKCKCDCGNEALVKSASLLSSNTRSCGCLYTTHGYSHHPLFSIWYNIIDRCNNPNNNAYHNYGGRGIVICDRWLHSFENFISDMGYRPSDLHSIDRINNNGNYEPNNCKWSTKEEQANNTRRNVIINYKGKQYTVAQLAREYNINDKLLYSRLSNGWTIEEAVEVPVN